MTVKNKHAKIALITAISVLLNTICAYNAYGADTVTISIKDDYSVLNSYIGTGSYIKGKTVTVRASLKDEHPFEGWYTKQNGQYHKEHDNLWFAEKAETNKIYIPNTIYNITYDLAGGEATNPSSYQLLQTLTLNNPVKRGYTFTGWAGTGIEGLSDSVTISEGSKGDRTYTANYDLNEYGITYILNRGTNSPENPGTYAVETENIELQPPTRAGYTFLGWTGSNGETPSEYVTIPKGSIEPKTYTANWTPNPDTAYVVEHEKQQLDGTYEVFETETFAGETDTEVEPATKNYEGFTPPERQKINIDGNGLQKVTYKYSRNSYDVVVNKGEGINITTGSGRYQYGEEVNVNYALMTGYKFVDWTGDETTATFTMPAHDVTMTANGTLIEYEITYDANGGVGDNVIQKVKWTATGTSTSATAKIYSYTDDCGFTKPNHRFLGWSTSKDGPVIGAPGADVNGYYQPGTEHNYSSGGIVYDIYGKTLEEAIEEPITLYAIYEEQYTATGNEGYYLITGTSQKGGDSEYKHWHLLNEDTMSSVEPTVVTGQGTPGVKFSGVFYVGSTVTGIEVKKDAEKTDKPHTYDNK